MPLIANRYNAAHHQWAAARPTHFVVRTADICFYKLTWRAKQKLMAKFEWQTVEEAADVFDNDPLRYMKECWPFNITESFDENRIRYTDGLFMTRYEGQGMDEYANWNF